MSFVDEDAEVDQDDLLPARKQQPDRPVPKQRQQETAEAITPPVDPADTREKPAKRSPLARGTVALGGIGVAGTLLAVVAAAGGPLALIATAAGTILVPLAWFTRNARNGRRGNSRARGGRQRGRNTRASWWPGGIGGGGRHGTGRGGSPGTRRGSTSGARSGGLPAGTGRRRGTGTAGGGPAGAGRRRAGSGVPGGAGRRAAGTGANWPGGRRGAGTGRAGGTGRFGGGHAGRTRRVPGFGGRRRGFAGRGSGTGRNGAGGRGYGPSRFGAPARGAWRAARGAGRRAARAARAFNRGGFDVGSAAARGARKATGRRAFRKAYQNFGKRRTPTTMSGWAARVAGGAVAGMSAGAARFFTNQARKLWRSLRNRYGPQTAQHDSGAGEQKKQKDSTKKPAGHQQHPVPDPAFTAPKPDPARPGGPDPAETPTPVPAGAGGDTTAGGSTMSAAFPPYIHAVDFHAACCKFQPLDAFGKPSIWPMQDALPLLKESVYAFTNGIGKFTANCEVTLEGGLHPGLKSVFAELWKSLIAASRQVEQLEPTFTKVYAEALARQATRGRNAENV